MGPGGEGSKKAMPSLVFSAEVTNSVVKGGRIMSRQLVGDKASTKISPSDCDQEEVAQGWFTKVCGGVVIHATGAWGEKH